MKKPSAPATAEPPPKPPKTLFVDRAIGKGPVEALRSKGASVIHLDELFPQNTEDSEWLARAGRDGWIVLTKDKQIRRKQNEVDAIIENGVVAVVLVSGNMGRAEMSELFCRVLDKILDVAGRATPPAVFTLRKDGSLTRRT